MKITGLKVLDQQGAILCRVEDADARQLIRMGHAKGFGTKNKLHGLKLSVSAAVAFGVGAQSLTGMIRTGAASRMHYREHVADKYYIWQVRDVPKNVRGLFTQALVPGTRASAVSQRQAG